MDRYETLSKLAPVSRETLRGLELYAEQLLKWQKSINLVGPDTIPQLWNRHYLDSLQLLNSVSGCRKLLDLGSGAGFPGMVLAIALRDSTDTRVFLVESNAKKCAFLRHIAMITKAPAEVLCSRIEAVIEKVDRPDIITARALAPLPQLIRWCEPLLKRGTIGLFQKGRGLDLELADAARYWDMEYEVIPSLVDSTSSILKVTAIQARQQTK